MSLGTAVVAGGGGFLGGHLVATLRQRGYGQIRCVDIRPIDAWQQVFDDVENVVADLSLREACDAACQGASEIYNLACDMGGAGYLRNHKAQCMLSVLINTHLLMAARTHDVQRYFFASSACVYDPHRNGRQRLTAFREQDAYPAKPEDGYGWEKLFGERLCRHFREDFGLETRVARFHNVYGPHDVWQGGRERVVAALCRKLLEAIHSEQNFINIWGDGQQARSFMYCDDCIEGILRIMHSQVSEPLNLGSDRVVTIDQLVSMLQQIAGVSLQRRYDPAGPTGSSGRSSDNSRIRERLGWAPTIPLEIGLPKTYAWVTEEFYRRQGRQTPGPRPHFSPTSIPTR